MQKQNFFFIFVTELVPVNYYKKLYTTPKIHIPNNYLLNEWGLFDCVAVNIFLSSTSNNWVPKRK